MQAHLSWARAAGFAWRAFALHGDICNRLRAHGAYVESGRMIANSRKQRQRNGRLEAMRSFEPPQCRIPPQLNKCISNCTRPSAIFRSILVIPQHARRFSSCIQIPHKEGAGYKRAVDFEHSKPVAEVASEQQPRVFVEQRGGEFDVPSKRQEAGFRFLDDVSNQ